MNRMCTTNHIKTQVKVNEDFYKAARAQMALCLVEQHKLEFRSDKAPPLPKR